MSVSTYQESRFGPSVACAQCNAKSTAAALLGEVSIADSIRTASIALLNGELGVQAVNEAAHQRQFLLEVIAPSS